MGYDLIIVLSRKESILGFLQSLQRGCLCDLKKLHTSLFSVDCNLRRLTLRIFIEVVLQYKGYSVYPKIHQSLLLSRLSPLLYLLILPTLVSAGWFGRRGLLLAKHVFIEKYTAPSSLSPTWIRHLGFIIASVVPFVSFFVWLFIYFFFYLLIALHLPFLFKSSRY